LVVVSARDYEHMEQLVAPTGNAVLHEVDCLLQVVDHHHLRRDGRAMQALPTARERPLVLSDTGLSAEAFFDMSSVA
jgi:hypothetical protein